MLRSPILLAVLFSLLLTTGCGTTGKDFSTARVSDIQNGVTTQTHVLDWFGLPYIEGSHNHQTMWTYQFDAYNSVGKDKSKDLVIVFDDNNVVKAYRFSTNMSEEDSAKQ